MVKWSLQYISPVRRQTTDVNVKYFSLFKLRKKGRTRSPFYVNKNYSNSELILIKHLTTSFKKLPDLIDEFLCVSHLF